MDIVQTLSWADPLHSSDLTVPQAFVIYLVCPAFERRGYPQKKANQPFRRLAAGGTSKGPMFRFL